MHAEPRCLVCTDQLQSIELLITCKSLANIRETVNVSKNGEKMNAFGVKEGN